MTSNLAVSVTSSRALRASLTWNTQLTAQHMHQVSQEAEITGEEMSTCSATMTCKHHPDVVYIFLKVSCSDV